MTGSEPRVSTNPFVGPRPFESGEPLYGRDREIRKLDNLLGAERVVLLYSPSGAGKSSLVQAGLMPQLKRSFDVWGSTRVNQEPPAGVDGNRYVLSTMAGLEEEVPEKRRQSPAVLAGQTLHDYLKGRPRRRSAPPAVLLIFDQFEEVLTVDPLAVEAKREFFDQLGELLRNPRVWALFVLREDYLAPLDPYAQQVPTHLRNRFRIDLLDLDGAREAMVSPARRDGREFPAAEQLVHDLATMMVQRADGSFVRRTGHHVEPVQLQVVCRRLWDAMPEDDLSIDPEDLAQFGDVNQALGGYYADSVARIAGGDTARERTVREWFDYQLITAGGIRGQVLKGIEESEGLANEVIARILDTHLVRAETRAGALWYELAHDRLIEPVRTNNAGWHDDHLSEVQQRATLWDNQARPIGMLLAAEEMPAAELWAAGAGVITAAEQDFLDASRRARAAVERERRQARRIKWLAVAGAIVSVLALVALVLAVRSRREAENLSRTANAGMLLAEGRITWGNLLILEARKPAETPAAVAVLHRALASPVETATLLGHTNSVMAASWSPDGSRVLTGSADQTARIWNPENVEPTATLPGHTGRVLAAWSPDGSRVLTASADKTVRIWDVENGETIVTLVEHTNAVMVASWSPDGSRVLTGSVDQTARIWDVETGETIVTLVGHTSWVIAASWSPDGSRVLTASLDQTARIWDVETGETIATLAGHTGEVLAASWSPDGSRVLTASWDETARIWNPETGETIATLVGHTDLLQAASWSPDGSRVLTASWDETARIWDVETGETIATLVGHTHGVWAASWSPDGSRVLTASEDQTARIWFAGTGETIATLVGHTNAVYTASWSPDGACVLTASEDKTARIWNPENGETIAALLGHTDRVTAPSWSPDGSRVLTASYDETARIWNPENGDNIVTLVGHTGRVLAASWSPDGSRVLTASNDETARIWNPENGDIVTLVGHTDGVVAGSWSPDGSRVLTASEDKTARIWNPENGDNIVTLVGHTGGVLAGSWSPDGSRVLTASEDKTARIWNPENGENIVTLVGHTSWVVAGSWSPDGSRVLTASWDDTARIWNPENGENIVTLVGHTARVVAGSWSPDGSRVLTASNDQTARIWNPENGDNVATLVGHTSAVFAGSWSPDGSRVLTASNDQTARIWNPENGESIVTLPGHTGGVVAGSWSPDGSRVLTASDDKTARIWAVSDNYRDYFRGRIRARTRLCLEPAIHQQYLGASAAEARRRHDACEACVPLFFERLGDASRRPWRTYEEAWGVYEECFFGRVWD